MLSKFVAVKSVHYYKYEYEPEESETETMTETGTPPLPLIIYYCLFNGHFQQIFMLCV